MRTSARLRIPPICRSCSTASQVGAMEIGINTVALGGGLPEHRLHQSRRRCRSREPIARGVAQEIFHPHGDDALTLPFMSVGAQGVISVASNLLPKQLTKMVHSYLKGDQRAR